MADNIREDGEWDGREVFHRMLRPELVQRNKTPLSSDVFTGWSMVRFTLLDCDLKRDQIGSFVLFLAA